MTTAATVNTGILQHVHSDKRRTIAECNLPSSSVQSFQVYQAIPLGNHYHKVRQETFVILKGEGEFISVPVDEEGQPLAEPKREEIAEGCVIQVQPYMAHVFILQPGSEMICFSSIRFDPDNMDMYHITLA